MRIRGRPKTPGIEKGKRGERKEGDRKKGGRDVVGRFAFEQVYTCAGIRSL